MTDRYPLMLLRFPAQLPRPAALQDGAYDTLIVADKDAEDTAFKDGWRVGTEAARSVVSATQEDAPPTRPELEQKAKELGLKFDGRTPDKKLGEMIAAKLA